MGYVLEFLKAKLPERWKVQKGGKIPEIKQRGNKTSTFDVVVESPKGRLCAIEISFQVTTNSTIEQKANVARSRFREFNKCGHKIAYVIDGAGNFERVQALKTLLRYCHCATTLREDELNRLVAFLLEMDEDSREPDE